MSPHLFSWKFEVVFLPPLASSSSYSQLMMSKGCPNHLRNAWYLGSITILRFGEPGSLGDKKKDGVPTCDKLELKE